MLNDQELIKKGQEDQKRKAKLVQQMMDSEGFKIIQTDLDGSSKNLVNDLIDAAIKKDIDRANSLALQISSLREFTKQLAFYSQIEIE